MQMISQFNISETGMCLTIHSACLRLTIGCSCMQVVYLGMGFEDQPRVSEQGRRECQYKVVVLTSQDFR